MKAGAVVAGGALGGLVDGKLVPGGIAGQPASAFVGAGLVAAGMLVLKGTMAEYALLAGAGMLSPVARDMVDDAVSDDADLSVAA